MGFKVPCQNQAYSTVYTYIVLLLYPCRFWYFSLPSFNLGNLRILRLISSSGTQITHQITHISYYNSWVTNCSIKWLKRFETGWVSKNFPKSFFGSSTRIKFPRTAAASYLVLYSPIMYVLIETLLKWSLTWADVKEKYPTWTW